MAVHFKISAVFYIILYLCGNAAVEMINLSAVDTFNMKMSLAFFVIDILIRKASVVSVDCSFNYTVFNKLCYKPVCGALAYAFIAYFSANSIYAEYK